jgi:hypothetical protein
MKPIAVLNRDGYEYSRWLLQEKKRELWTVELKHRNNLTPANEYFSCRRSLLQAINELENLLRTGPKGIQEEPGGRRKGGRSNVNG